MEEQEVIIPYSKIQEKPKRNIKLPKIQLRKISGVLNIFIAVILSIGIFGFFFIRTRALNVISEFEREIALIEKTTFVFDINIQEEIPVKINWKLSELVNLDTIIPDSIHISEEIPVNDTIAIDTNVTTTIAIPLYGNADITVPIKSNIPVNMQVPVDTDISLADAEIKDQDINVNTKVPVDMQIQVEKTIAELGLTQHIEQTKRVLSSLRLFFLSSESADIENVEPQVVTVEIGE